MTTTRGTTLPRLHVNRSLAIHEEISCCRNCFIESVIHRTLSTRMLQAVRERYFGVNYIRDFVWRVFQAQ